MTPLARTYHLPGDIDEAEKCYLEPSCCTMASDFATC
jgi:hypothetical protein